MMTLALDDDYQLFSTKTNVVYSEILEPLVLSVSSTIHLILALGQPGYLSLFYCWLKAKAADSADHLPQFIMLISIYQISKQILATWTEFPVWLRCSKSLVMLQL